ncbi:lytic polysaccharide monooxygenase [Pseudoalteromonas ruthenica]|uniref:lytic polysaccharide monooxygenase n=1 Tax=Pseudoalteromonas ruthenica TaxID=151081 RepID=UPI0026D9C860
MPSLQGLPRVSFVNEDIDMRTPQAKLLSLAVSALAVGAALSASQAYAHGYMDSPKARQAICQAQGGYWWPEDGSNIPNLACRAAYLESGHFQFIQEHEFAVNTADYYNQAAVETSVPDGTLCAAGDTNKRGMNLPSAHWQRSDVTPNANGEIKVRFRATTPHNPSFWKFYLSKPGFDGATQTLAWSDLELVQEVGNIDFIKDAEGHRYYEMNVAIPAERQGDAILYTRWQRDDAAGEGFYNCSDITIVRDGGPSDPSQWQSIGYYLQQGQTPAVGDSIWVRLFDESGQELVNQMFAVSADNQSSWQQDLAAMLNLDYSQYMQIGLQDQQGQVVYQSGDPLVNQVYTTNANYSYSLSVQQAPGNSAPTVVKPDDITLAEGQSSVVHVHAFDDEQSTLNYSWDVPAPLTMSSEGANLTITAANVDTDTPYTITVTVSDGELSTSQSFVVTVTDTSTNPDPSYPAWQASATYVAGDKVSYNASDYEAKWWNQGEQPDQSSAWQTLSKDAGSAQWDSQRAYESGATVLYQGQQYQAKWWTQGDTPGQASVWQAL